MIDDTGHAQDTHQRQFGEYFGAWVRALQQAAGPVSGPAAGADGMAGGPWLQAIHQLARQALEQGLDSAGIAQAWRQMLNQGLWPDPLPLNTLFGAGPAAWDTPASAWPDHPAFGPMREHLQRWQQMAQQQRHSQQTLGGWQPLLAKVRELALEQFEQLLRAHEERPLADARALLDLWVDAAERAWQEVAMGEEFAQLLAQFNQTQMQLLQAQQAEAERLYAGLGIASRRELDQAYARIDALERQLRQVLAMHAATGPAAHTRGKPAQPTANAAARPRARRTAAAAAAKPAKATKATKTAAKKRPLRPADQG